MGSVSACSLLLSSSFEAVPVDLAHALWLWILPKQLCPGGHSVSVPLEISSGEMPPI